MSTSDTVVSSTANNEVDQQGPSAEVANPETLEFRHALRGSILIAAFAVGLLFLGWLAFYFLVFMARGYVG